MDATDEQFQAFIAGASVPVDDQGIVEWSFDDRCRVINYTRRSGIALPFVDPNKKNVETIPRQELFEVDKPPSGEHPVPILDGWFRIIKGTLEEKKNNAPIELFADNEQPPEGA